MTPAAGVRRATAGTTPRPAPDPLCGEVRRVETLTAGQRAQMQALLARYFANVTADGFAGDLAEKEWVVLLQQDGEIRGFSTLMCLRLHVGGRPVVAFFSGDTIVDAASWGDGGNALPRHFARHVFTLAAAERLAHPAAAVYWYLISSGYKTYRFLPVFFREFYPTYRCPTPPQTRELLHALGRLKFPSEYDPAAGVIRLGSAHRTALRAGVAEIEAQRLGDPHVAFFAAANPGHRQGDELACLTLIDPANLTPAGERMLFGRRSPPDPPSATA